MRILKTGAFFNHPGICYRRPPGWMGGGGASFSEADILQKHQAFSATLVSSPYSARTIAQALGGLSKLLLTPAVNRSFIGICRQAASISLTNNDYLSAANCYNYAAEVSNEISDFVESGNLYESVGGYQEAGHAFRQVVDLCEEEEKVDYWLRAGENFEQAGTYAVAGAAFRNVYGLNQDPNYLVRAAQNFTGVSGYGESVAWCLETAAKGFEEKDAATLWKLAGDAYKSIGRNRDAAFAYEQAAKLTKGEEKFNLWLLAGESFLAADAKKEAYYCFCQVSRDRRPSAFYTLSKQLGHVVPNILSAGAALEEQGNACEGAEARGFYRKAGDAFAAEEKHMEACFVFAKAAAIAEGKNKTHLLHQAARQAVLARSYGKALDLVEQAMQEEGNPSLWQQLASLVQKLNRFLRFPEDKAKARRLLRQLERRF